MPQLRLKGASEMTTTKVTLEITSEKFTWTVFAGDSEMAAHTMKRVDRGCFKGVGKGGIGDRLPEDEFFEELYEALEDGDPSGISDALLDF